MHALIYSAITNPVLGKLARACFGNYLTIFTLHRPAPANQAYEGTDPAFLQRCLQYAQENNFAFASIDELVTLALQGGRLTKPTLCFTLDDGYADQLTELVPVLLRYQAKPTLYVIADLVDGIDWPWDAKLAHILWHSKAPLTQFTFGATPIPVDLSQPKARKESRRRLTRFAKTLDAAQLAEFMSAAQSQFAVTTPKHAPEQYRACTWEQLRDAERQGLTIGSHNRSHHTLNALDSAQIRAELNHTNARLATEIHSPSKVFCYPSGTAQDFSPEHASLIAQAGFKGAVTTVSKVTNLQAIRAAPFQIHRIGLPNQFQTFVRYASWFEYVRSTLT